MKKIKPNEWRSITKAEVNSYKKAYAAKVGRPAKSLAEKGIRISLILEPETLKKFKEKSKRLKKPYQTLINEALKKAS